MTDDTEAELRKWKPMTNGGHDPELNLGGIGIEEAVEAVCELGRKIDWDWRNALPGEPLQPIPGHAVLVPDRELLPRKS